MRERMAIRIGRRVVFLRVAAIDYIEADDNYIRINAEGKSYLIRQTLKSMEKMLDSDRMVRINRSVLVNLDRIKELQADDSYSYTVVVEGDKQWQLGRKFCRHVRQLLLN